MMPTSRLPLFMRPVALDVPRRFLEIRSSSRVDVMKHRFPHMFEGVHAGRTFFRGWIPALTCACEQIGQVLNERAHEFRWVKIGEVNGDPLFLYLLGERRRFVVDLTGKTKRVDVLVESDADEGVCHILDGIVNEAERIANYACIVCGKNAEPAKHFGTGLTLCPSHAPNRLNRRDEEGLQGVWREAIEWEE